jgi:hypothetical protein
MGDLPGGDAPNRVEDTLLLTGQVTKGEACKRLAQSLQPIASKTTCFGSYCQIKPVSYQIHQTP